MLPATARRLEKSSTPNTDSLINGFILFEVSNAFTSPARDAAGMRCMLPAAGASASRSDDLCVWCVRRTVRPVCIGQKRRSGEGDPEDQRERERVILLVYSRYTRQYTLEVYCESQTPMLDWVTRSTWRTMSQAYGHSLRLAYTVTNPMLKFIIFFGLPFFASPKPKMYEKQNFRVFYTQARISFLHVKS